MTAQDEPPISVPDSLATPGTYLVMGSIDPAASGLSLRLLGRYSEPDDGALVVSTTESGAETVERLDSWRADGQNHRLGSIDTVSRHQYISALYEEIPTVYLPSAQDLERIVMALAELTEVVRPRGSRHLVVRSLTPALSTTNVDDVGRFLERVLGLRTGSGLAFVGLDLSAHDDAVVETLLRHVDGVLWATADADGSIELTARSTRRIPV